MHIDSTVSQIKRAREEKDNEDQPPLKKAKIESTQDSTSQLLKELPIDLLQRICLFLPTAKDIFSFELIFEKAREYTAMAWQMSAKRDLSPQGLNIDWPLSDKERYRERTCYIHGTLLCSYMASTKNIRSQTNHTLNDVKKLFDRFKEIMMCYPSLGAYLWKDLNQLENIDSIDGHIFRSNPVVQPNHSFTAGGFLLEGLSHLAGHKAEPDDRQKQMIRQSAFNALRQAAQKGAACASFFAFQVLSPHYHQTNKWCYHLALSLINKTDYLGLRLLVSYLPLNYIKQVYTEGAALPPILEILGFHSTSLKEKETLWEEAIRGYQQDYVPADLWRHASHIKNQVQKPKEAESYADQAIAAYHKEFKLPPPEILMIRGTAKWKQNNKREAVIDWDKALRACETQNQSIPAKLYHMQSLGKQWQKQWKEAEEYADKALNAYRKENTPISVDVWQNTFYIEFNYCLANHSIITNSLKFDEWLNLVIKAIDYGCQTMTSYGENNIPPHLWSNMACLLSYLSKYDLSLRNQVNNYLDKARASLESNKFPISPETYLNIANIQTVLYPLQIRKLNQADLNTTYIRDLNQGLKDFEMALNIYTKEKRKIPYHFYEARGYLKLVMWNAKKELNLLKEAEEDLNKVIETYKDEVNCKSHLFMALVKKSLDKWEEAEEHADKARLLYEKGIPAWLIPDLYPTVIQIKEKLNKFTEAKENADEANRVYGEKYWYPVSHNKEVEIIAKIKEKLSPLNIISI